MGTMRISRTSDTFCPVSLAELTPWSVFNIYLAIATLLEIEVTRHIVMIMNGKYQFSLQYPIYMGLRNRVTITAELLTRSL